MNPIFIRVIMGSCCSFWLPRAGSSQWVLSSFDGVLWFVHCLRHLAAASSFAGLKEGCAIELLDCGVLVASLMICDSMTWTIFDHRIETLWLFFWIISSGSKQMFFGVPQEMLRRRGSVMYVKTCQNYESPKPCAKPCHAPQTEMDALRDPVAVSTAHSPS